MKAVKEKTEKRRWRMSRRGFLIGAGTTIGVLAVGGRLGLEAGRPRLVKTMTEGGANFGEAAPGDPDLWLELASDNTITLYSPKVEFGQGIHTTLAQIAAEELGADPKQMRVTQATTSHGFNSFTMFTLGSISVSSLYKPIREAAATLREMVRSEAATQLNVSINSVVVSEGRFYSNETNKTSSYGEIVAAKSGEWVVPEEAAALKTNQDFSVIGQKFPRLDLQNKIMGKAVYGYDARAEGMLYGAFAQPPRYGATLKSANVGNAEQMPGVVRVVVEDDFVGIVAERRSQARKALESLQLEWQGGISWNQSDLEAAVTVNERRGAVIRRDGNARRVLNQGNAIKAEYRTPLAAHAFLEPQAALVNSQGESAEVWVSTQFPGTVREDVAKVLSLKEENVLVNVTYLGGGFGGKDGSAVATAAARLSRAAGKPVHVGRTRTEELRYSTFRPPTHHVLRGAVDGNGNIVALEHHGSSGNVLTLPEVAERILGFDIGAIGSLVSHYNVPNYRVVAHRAELPVPTSSWRSLGHFPNTFALESFIDELAVSVNVDPLEFRLQNLDSTDWGERLKNVLQVAAERSGWGGTLPQGYARGIACGFYGPTVVAQVAEVALESNKIQVKRFTSAVDCGLVINPDGALAQAQGSIIMGLSSTLLEQLTLKDGMVEADNFGQYPLLTIAQAPQIDVVFTPSGEEPYGMGEPVIVPVAAAVANAVYALTGQRLRNLPLTLA